MSNLIDCIDKLHTTELGAERVRRNLGLDSSVAGDAADVVAWCRARISMVFVDSTLCPKVIPDVLSILRVLFEYQQHE